VIVWIKKFEGMNKEKVCKNLYMIN